jgi:hypothetical protein
VSDLDDQFCYLLNKFRTFGHDFDIFLESLNKNKKILEKK